MRVKSPIAQFTGLIGHDIFVDGVCEEASPNQEMYYRRHGYLIDEGESTESIGVDALGSDRSEWKKPMWLLHAGALGLDVDEKATVAEIKAAVAEHEAEPFTPTVAD